MDMSHATSTPSIRIYDSGPVHSRYSLPRRSSYVSAPGIPMAIPNARESPPPPLPPPRYIGELSEGQDPGWQWGNSNNSSSAGFGRSSFVSIKPGSSLLGGGGQLRRDKPADHGERNGYGVVARRDGPISATKYPRDTEMSNESPDSDEDRGVLSRPPLSKNHR